MSGKRNGNGGNGGGEMVTTGGVAPDWASARAQVDEALRRVEALGRAVFDQPGNRDDVGRLLAGSRSALCSVAGTLAEAEGVNARVEAQRAATLGFGG
ncbi:MAG: hypothetical protein OXF93_23510 [Acidobacteria bacterium]|nr:hypothetical protein [Acidobacteriota bacterium]